jgi:transcriptional regulator with XRE-family HTH domain
VATPAERRSQLGPYLKQVRERLGLSLRKVEEFSNGRIHNAYLSQIESGRTKNPNPDLIAALADVYGLDYWNLLYRAGWSIPEEYPKDERDWHGWPLRDLLDLTKDEMDELLDFAAYLRRKRERKASTRKVAPRRPSAKR